MSQIQEVKDATDIVTIIGERLTLQRAGSYYKANCPFHSERSPSFFVNEVIQRYKCYGCGEHGDVFEFLEKYEGLTFYETLKYLAEKAGVTLKEQVRTKDDELRDEVLAALNLAKEYYHYLLITHEVGAPAREYLKNRGISTAMIKHFGVGYSLDSWDGLLTFLEKKKKISPKVLLAAGLVITGKTNRSYDRFRGRIMFPLKNNRGQVVGFSGRTLDSDAKEAKYINSPETMVYHKSSLLFGYSEQLQEIRKAKTMIVVEGEFDVISSVQAHVPNIVAIKGSAFTKEQARLVARLVETVYLSLDTDAAGVKATKEALKVLKPHEIDVRVIKIPEGKDPDELARHHPKEWREATKRSISVYEFLLESALKQHDHTAPEGKRAIMKEIAPYISEITHAVEREHYITLLASALKVKQDVVRSDVAMYSSKKPKVAERAADQDQRATTDNAKAEQRPLSGRERNERYSLFLLFLHEESDIPIKALELKELQFTYPGAQKLITLLQEYGKKLANTQQKFSLRAFSQQLPSDLQQLLLEVTTNPELISLSQSLDLSKEWKHTIKDLKQSSAQLEVERIAARLEELDEISELSPEEEAEQQELLQKIVTLKHQSV